MTNQIFFKFGNPLVNLFATRHNHRLPLYVSPMYDPAVWAVDALSFDWDQLDAYAYPPTHSDGPNIGENQGECVSHIPDCPLVAQEILVQQSSQSLVQLFQDTSSQIRSSVSKRQTSYGSSNVPLTHLAVIRQSLQKTLFCQGLKPRCFCKEEVHQSSL